MSECKTGQSTSEPLTAKILEAYLAHGIFRVLDAPITFASGIESPVYCDNRKVLGFPELRSLVLKELMARIEPQLDQVDAIVGVATGGIPLAAQLALLGNLAFGYVRRAAKGHGTAELVEGVDVKKKKVVLFEDCLTTGASVLACLRILERAGADVRFISSVFDYELLTESKRRGYFSGKWSSLITFKEIVSFMLKREEITTQTAEKLTHWHTQNCI